MSASLYFNPSCSKCRTASSLLDELGVDYAYVHYLDEHPSTDELNALMARLGINDPRAMMRTDEALYGELGLATASRERLLYAITEHPVLLERPILVVGDRAVIGRPPERVLELLRLGDETDTLDRRYRRSPAARDVSETTARTVSQSGDA